MTVRQEKELLTQQLLNTIKHKVALSQELDAWQVSGERRRGGEQVDRLTRLTAPLLFQEDMRLVIVQQVQQREEERQKERERERENPVGLQRSKSLRVKGEGGKGFFSSLFKDK